MFQHLTASYKAINLQIQSNMLESKSTYICVHSFSLPLLMQLIFYCCLQGVHSLTWLCSDSPCFVSFFSRQIHCSSVPQEVILSFLSTNTIKNGCPCTVTNPWCLKLPLALHKKSTPVKWQLLCPTQAFYCKQHYWSDFRVQTITRVSACSS